MKSQVPEDFDPGKSNISMGKARIYLYNQFIMIFRLSGFIGIVIGICQAIVELVVLWVLLDHSSIPRYNGLAVLNTRD